MFKYILGAIFAVTLLTGCGNPYAAQAWQQTFQNMANSRYQRQFTPLPAYVPTQQYNTYGTIMTPSGQTYNYNSTTY